MPEWTPLDIDVIREEWGYADEAGQREWALEHADDLMAEVERLRRALAGHLFDGESLSTREAIRSELITAGFEAAARAEAAEAKVRAGRIVAEHWRDALMATAREHPENALGTHPVAMVLAALDGETDPTAVGIDPEHVDAARLAALGIEVRDA